MAAEATSYPDTFITEGNNGRLIEVTKDLEVVWEYISPYTYFPDMFRKRLRTMVYRAYRVPYDYVPQLEAPVEEAVVPPDNKTLRLKDLGIDR